MGASWTWFHCVLLLSCSAAASLGGSSGEACSAEGGTCAAGSDSWDTDGSHPACGCGALKRSDYAGGHAEEPAGPAAAGGLAPSEEAGESEEEAGAIYLQGGRFIMGLIPEDEGDPAVYPTDGEGPSHVEVVGPFGMGAHEVSNRRFAKFVQQTGYTTESEKFGWSFGVEPFITPETNATITQQVDNAPWWLPVNKADWRHPNGPDTSVENIMDHPVTQVSLADAEAFCRWSRPGGRLPTEPEWELAARGGRRQRRFPWGQHMLSGKSRRAHRMNIWQSELDERLLENGRPINLYRYGENALGLVKEYYLGRNTALDGYSATAPVDAYGPQNKFGFYNLIGNVWEWTSSRWSVRDPRAPPVDPNTMVKKGGSFLCSYATCFRFRCSARMMFTADSAASNVGFRCAYPHPDKAGP